MRWTRLGLSVLAAAAGTAFGGLVGGNNLLYLIAAGLMAALAAAAMETGIGGLVVTLEFPEQIFLDAACRLEVEVRNPRRRPRRHLAITGPGGRAELPWIPGRGAARAELPHTFKLRGKVRACDLALETSHPLGLFKRHRKLREAVITVLPRLFEIQSRPHGPSARQDSAPRPCRGRGDELRGVRDYDPAEDARLIHWKLTARTGKPLILEYDQAAGRRVTITADGAPGPGTEERISEAASLARFFIDDGAEVALETPEGTIGHGRGLLHLQTILQALALLGEGKRIREAAPQAQVAKPRAGSPPRPSLPLYLTAGAAIASLRLVDLVPAVWPWIAALALLPLGWAFDKRGRHPIPRWIFDAGALAVLLLAFLGGFRSLGLVPMTAVILLYVSAAYLWSPKTPPIRSRLLLSLFLLFVLSSSQAVDIWYFPLGAAFFAAAGAWLDDWLKAGSRPARRARRALAPLAGRAFLLAGLLFAILPRAYSPGMQQLLAASGLSRLQDPRRSFAGLADRVDLGFFGPLRKNPARAMQVGFPDPPPGFVRPEALRIRAGSFDRFTGRRWIRGGGDFQVKEGGSLLKSRGGLLGLRSRDGRIVFPGYDPARPAVTQELLVYPMIGSTVFAAGGIGALETGARSAAFDIGDTVSFPFLYGAPIRYRVRAAGDAPAFGEGIEGYSGILKTRFLDTAGLSERWRAEARQAAGAAATPAARAAAVESWLRRRGTYSLAASDNRQDLDAFLWTTRAGNCEYFASTMVLLLRCLDIPSRLAVGFLASEWNEFGSFFDVRQSDAHAWVEAYLPGRGWTAFDPTPADSEGASGPSLLAGLWGRIRRGFSAVESRWYRYVVGYDPETRMSLLRSLAAGLGPWLLPAGAAGLLAAAGMLAAAAWRRRAREGRKERRARRRHFYYRVLDGLARSGFPRPAGQTAADWAKAVVEKRPDLSALIPLTEAFSKARYAGVAMSETDERRARATAETITRAARRPPAAASSSSPA